MGCQRDFVCGDDRLPGALWAERYLPKEYPAWQSVYYYFDKWQKDGTWLEIHERLRCQVRQKAGRHKHPTGGCLDSQSVKTTAVPGERGYDAAKKVVGRKRHILVDTLGLLLCVVVTAACISESAGAGLVLSRMPGGCKKLRKVWVGCPLGGAGILERCWNGRSCSGA